MSDLVSIALGGFAVLTVGLVVAGHAAMGFL